MWRLEIFQIKELIQINGKKYADTMLISNVRIDEIMRIKFGTKDSEENFYLFELKALSPPLVTATEDNDIWFLGDLPSTIPWINEHLSTY